MIESERMSEKAYRATMGDKVLRIHAYHPKLEPIPERHLKVSVQAVIDGIPNAEKPLHVEHMLPSDLANALWISQAQGWEIRDWVSDISSTKNHENQRAR